jgi:ribosomal protein S27E
MKRKIYRVDHRTTHTNSGHRLERPFTVVTLCGCVHEHVVYDGDSAEPGTEVECTSCGDLEPHFARIREFVASGRYSHATRRSTAASRCRAWEHFMFYCVDRSSPTQCHLEFSAPACDEIEALLVELGVRALPGPSRGAMAML